MSKHVLVIADKAQDDFLSLEKADNMARDISASFEIVKFGQYDEQSDETLEQYVAKMEEILQTMIDNVFEDQSNITSKVVISDNINEWVVERCENLSNPIDLVIKGGHRSESLFHTPTDWKLIRHLHCPILIASHNKWKSKTNILMTLDLSRKDQNHQQLNDMTLKWGEMWSHATNTSLHSIYSIPIAKPLLELDIVDRHEVKHEKAPAALEQMQTILAAHDLNDVNCHVPAGPPDRTIPSLAKKLRTDLVIMGCLGREGVSGLLFGNTAEKVLHHLRTDCLILKLPEYSKH